MISSIRLIPTIVDEFQRRLEIVWISRLSTRDRRIWASVPRSINEPLPARVEVRLGPLRPCKFGARRSPAEVVQHAAVVQDDESLIKAVIEMSRMAHNLLAPVLYGRSDVLTQRFNRDWIDQ